MFAKVRSFLAFLAFLVASLASFSVSARDISSSDICKYEDATVEIPVMGPHFAGEPEPAPRVSKIVFHTPLDCEGNMLVPSSLEDLELLIAKGLSAEDAVGIARWVGLKVEGPEGSKNAKRPKGTEVGPGDMIGFEYFLINKYSLSSGPLGEKAACAARDSADVEAVIFGAIMKKDRDDNALNVSFSDNFAALTFAAKVVELCEEGVSP